MRRIGLEDDVELLTPYEYAANTSELIQLLEKGHYGVMLDQQAKDRLITWIDLNAPCHGTWSDMYEIPDNNHARRMLLQTTYGGPDEDPEELPITEKVVFEPIASIEEGITSKMDPVLEHWPLSNRTATDQQHILGEKDLLIEMGNGIQMAFKHIPPGVFVMGVQQGECSDKQSQIIIEIKESFWISTFEVTNHQYKLFNSEHDSKYYAQRHIRYDDKGLSLNKPNQPVVRISWEDANGFCNWLSKKTGKNVNLPTEAQWEYACRGGTSSYMFYGNYEDDFSEYANLADQSFDPRSIKPAPLGIELLLPDGSGLTDNRFNDRSIVTCSVGSYKPNRWGLHDIHGNAAEWTRKDFIHYPYPDTDNVDDNSNNKVVRGGSFFDRPERAASGYRLSYHPWQKVFNVGFRVVIED